ncbi:MAG: TolC family protein [bacterium]|nr:TolC family protein [bacterium]
MRQSTIINTVSFLLFAVFIFTAAGAWAEESKPGFDNYMNIVKTKLPELEKNRIAVSKAKNAIKKAGAAGDIGLSTTGTYYGQKEYSVGSSFNMDYTNGYSVSAGLDKTFTTTGTRVSAGVDYAQATIDGTYTATSQALSISTYQPQVSLGLSQPILYNCFGILDRYAEKDAKMKLETEKLKKLESDKTALNYYKKLYFEAVQYNQALGILKTTISNAKKLEAQVRRKARAGLSDNDDVQRSRSSVLRYRSNHTQYQAAYNRIQEDLAIVLGPQKDKPDDNSFTEYFNSALNTGISRVPFKKTTGAKILELTLANLEYTREMGENKLLPQLNLVGAVTRKGSKDSFSGAARGMSDTDYSIGFEFKHTLGNNAAESDLKDIELSIRDLRKDFEKQENSYRKNLAVVITALEGNKEILKIKEKNLAVLKSQRRTERTKYSQARLALSYLVDTDNKIASEQIEILALKKQIIDLYFDYVDLTK